MSNQTNLGTDQPGEISIDAMLDRINRMASGENVPAIEPAAPQPAAPPTAVTAADVVPELVTAATATTRRRCNAHRR